MKNPKNLDEKSIKSKQIHLGRKKDLKPVNESIFYTY